MLKIFLSIFRRYFYEFSMLLFLFNVSKDAGSPFGKYAVSW
jgi:hypothetical protein